MGVDYNPSVISDSLVLHLDAKNPKSYSGTGTSWLDMSGTGNNGTLVNTPTFDSANGDLTFAFASSEQVTFANTNSLMFLGRAPYTLEAWVYPTRNPGASNWTGLFNRESTFNGVRDGFNLYFLGSATTQTSFAAERFEASNSGRQAAVFLDQSLTVNTWNHIVTTYDGTNMTLYRNGANVAFNTAQSANNIQNTSQTLTIANRGGQFFDGKISNAKIYKRALSEAEVKRNYYALKGRHGIL